MCLLLLNLQMDDIKYAFDKFADGDGEISLERLAEVHSTATAVLLPRLKIMMLQVLKELGIGASNEEVERMFKQADADGGGVDL